MADQFAELRDKLALQVEENRSLRVSSAQTIAQKDEEIKILREMGIEIKSAYERAIAEMKRQVGATAVEAQKRISNSETKMDDALLSQLTRDNEYLRDELRDIRQRSSNTATLLSPVYNRSTGALYQTASPRLRAHKHAEAAKLSPPY
jgi:DNA anti-recombination protein RmuC